VVSGCVRLIAERSWLKQSEVMMLSITVTRAKPCRCLVCGGGPLPTAAPVTPRN
jgi:hypothetical protein